MNYELNRWSLSVVVQEPDVLRVNMREGVPTACTGNFVVKNSPQCKSFAD